MAWIESHQTILTHRKTTRLARLLGVTKVTAIGHLHVFWWWCLDNAPAGVLEEIEALDIAEGAAWEGDPDQFLAAMIESGWLDRDGDAFVIHDWYDYAGKLMDRRAANAERMRERRARTSVSRSAHVSSTLRARAPATGPNRTGPDPVLPPELIAKEPEVISEGVARATSVARPPSPSRLRAIPKPSVPDLAPLFEAFKAAGLDPPPIGPGDARAGSELLKLYAPRDVAGCWAWVLEHGSPGARERLSLNFLTFDNRVANWKREHGRDWNGHSEHHGGAARPNGARRSPTLGADPFAGFSRSSDPDDDPGPADSAGKSGHPGA